MLNGAALDSLGRFLADSGKTVLPRIGEATPLFARGATIGNWRVEAFLGRGGSGEVYRVVHSVTRTPAAAKVLIRKGEVTERHFREEIGFLAQNRLPQCPRYFESGEAEGVHYLIMELLEPLDVPTDEQGIAAYLIDVCACVRALHLAGIVHRDLKPKNILRRSSGEVVLIDFGLAKDTLVSTRPRADVSIVAGKAVGVGTPEYAAPEQLLGGKVSAAADIHALGRIANTAFGGRPPRSWAAILRRATSSVAELRYATVDDFALAIRHRNRRRRCLVVGITGALILAMASLCLRTFALERYAWYRLCENVQTDPVTQPLDGRNPGAGQPGRPELPVTMIRLQRQHHTFTRPLDLKANREYWLVGPGTLDAPIRSEGSNTTIRLKDCVVLNRSEIPFADSGIRYVFQGFSYLNFTAQDKPREFSVREFEGFDVTDDIKFRGPETLEELRDLQRKENFEQTR